MSTATEALTRTTGADPGSGAVQTADRLIIFGITGDDDWTVENLRKRARTSIEDCGETIDEDVFGRFLQLVAVAAMEAPAGKDAKTQKDAKYALFRSVETADPARYVRGHAYAPGSWGPPVADELLGRHSTRHGPWLPS